MLLEGSPCCSSHTVRYINFFKWWKAKGKKKDVNVSKAQLLLLLGTEFHSLPSHTGPPCIFHQKQTPSVLILQYCHPGIARTADHLCVTILLFHQ